MQTVHDFFKKTGAYYLATADGDQPRVRPFGTMNLFEGKLYIQTAKMKDVSKQITANPKVELCAFDGETWIRITCSLVEDNRPEAQESLLEAYPNLRDRYSVGDDNNMLYYMKDATATFYSFSGAQKVVRW